MKQKHQVPLSLEALEDRWVPATIRLVGSDLLVSNPIVSAGSSTLTLTQTSSNVFRVADNGMALGNYSVGGLVYVAVGNSKNTTTVDLNGNSYTGDLLVNSGNGKDVVTIGSRSGGAIVGNTTILTGNGADTVNLNSTSVGSVFFGGTVQAVSTGGNGSSVLNLGNGTGSTTLGGDLTTTGYGNELIGGGKADSIGGNLSIQNYQTSAGNSIELNGGLTVGKNVTYTGGSGADSFFLGDHIGDPGLTINGNVQLNGGGGDNDVTSPGSAYNLVVGGNMTVMGGSGANNLGLGGSVQGNLTVQLGDGNNGTNPAFPNGLFFNMAVSGNENITLGNGNNVFNAVSFGPGQVGGNLNVTLGNGNNGVVTFEQSAPGGLFHWSSGNGADTLTLAPIVAGQTFNVNAQFGNQDDGFVLAGSAGTLTGSVNGGGRINGNTFVQDGWTLVPTFVLSNFP